MVAAIQGEHGRDGVLFALDAPVLGLHGRNRGISRTTLGRRIAVLGRGGLAPGQATGRLEYSHGPGSHPGDNAHP